MVMLADVGGISGIRTTLSSVKVPPDVIDEIVKVLEETSGTLDPGGFRAVQGTWYGDRGSARLLASHTDKAHLALANSVIEAVSGIQETGLAMEQFEAEINQADADSEQAARSLLARTQLAVDQMDGDRHTPPTHTHRPGSNH
jgi:hypothetical protein